MARTMTEISEMIKESRLRWENGGNASAAVEIVLDREQIAADKRREWWTELSRAAIAPVLAAAWLIVPFATGNAWMPILLATVPVLIAALLLSLPSGLREYDLLAVFWDVRSAGGRWRWPRAIYHDIERKLTRSGGLGEMELLYKQRDSIAQSHTAALLRVLLPFLAGGLTTIVVRDLFAMKNIFGASIVGLVTLGMILVSLYLTRGFQKWPSVTTREGRLQDSEMATKGMRRSNV